MSSVPQVNNTSTESGSADKKNCDCKWMTMMFWVMIFFILLFLATLLISCSEVGSVCSPVPVCSGEMWYDCMIGSL